MTDAPHVIPETDGLHGGVLDLHYRQWAALSQSRLKIFERSPAHYRAHVDDPRPPTAGQQRNYDVGSATHMAVLQPHEFEKWFHVRPLGNANSNAYKSAVERIRRDNPWARILRPDDWELVARIRDAVHANADARTLLGGSDVVTELSVVWTEPEKIDRTPLRAKARLDVYNPTLGVVADVKTCVDARPEAFSRQIDNLRYYRQACWYLRGAEAIGLGSPDWVFLAVEKTPPFAVWCHELPSGWIALGDDELEPLLDRFVACQSSGVWPAYPGGIHTVYPTEWQAQAARRRADELVAWEAYA